MALGGKDSPAGGWNVGVPAPARKRVGQGGVELARTAACRPLVALQRRKPARRAARAPTSRGPSRLCPSQGNPE